MLCLAHKIYDRPQNKANAARKPPKRRAGKKNLLPKSHSNNPNPLPMHSILNQRRLISKSKQPQPQHQQPAQRQERHEAAQPADTPEPQTQAAREHQPRKPARASANRAGFLSASQRSNNRTNSSGPHLHHAMNIPMLPRNENRQIPTLIRHPQPLAQRLEQIHTAPFMPNMPRQHILRRRRLAQIMRQRSKPHRQRIPLRRGMIHHHHHMHARIHLRMVISPLRHAPQRIDLRQNPRKRAALAQHLEHPRRPLLHQAA